MYLYVADSYFRPWELLTNDCIKKPISLPHKFRSVRSGVKNSKQFGFLELECLPHLASPRLSLVSSALALPDQRPESLYFPRDA